jgi:hypothetical protein
VHELPGRDCVTNSSLRERAEARREKLQSRTTALSGVAVKESRGRWSANVQALAVYQEAIECACCQGPAARAACRRHRSLLNERQGAALPRRTCFDPRRRVDTPLPTGLARTRLVTTSREE